MTNKQIIFENSVFLMEQGLLKGTGETVSITDERGTREIQMPEPIHTFDMWKKLGYQVQKGEHAVAKFPIWKFKPNGKEEEEAENDQKQSGKMFMKMSSFFTEAQVKPIERR